MSKNELALSMDNVRKEGINIEVNQKDIIEMLVQEKIEQIELEVAKIDEEAKTLNQEVIDFYNTEFQKHVKLPKPKTKGLVCSFNGLTKSRNHNSNKNNGYISSVDCSDYKHGFNLSKRGIYKDFSEVMTGFRIEYTYTIEGIDFIKHVNVDVSSVIVDLCPKILAKIDKHNERVAKFLAEHPTFISESTITKKLKASFTKEILKTTSASFQKKLSANFGVKL
jgi:hypothetical protein